jgi:hypothetical protein
LSFDKLIGEYGFLNVGKKTNGEDVFLKRLLPTKEALPDVTKAIIRKLYYPSFYDGPEVSKLVVPIKPDFHDILFDDYLSNKRQASIEEFAEEGRFKVPGNTISKAYLCHALITTVSKNDIILFYRSHDLMAITTVGVVESTYRLNDATKIQDLVGNRTVYSLEKIEEMAEKPTLVILFRWHFYLKKAVELYRLISLGILKNGPQSIMAINDEKYHKIKKEGRLNERYTIH